MRTDLVCSHKECRDTASRAVVWNNPQLHEPGRRKVWTACGEHVQFLQDFVALRGFHVETIGVDELREGDG